MKNLNKLTCILMIFVVVLTSFATLPRLNAATYKVYTVKYKCPIRTEASENSNIILNGKDTVYVYPNDELEYIKSATGPNNGRPNETWYAVKFDYAAREYTGYVAKACMYDPKSYSYNDDTAFESSISSFPDSYKPYLRKLHAIYPNWNFKADINKLDWNTAVEAESQKGMSAISHLYPSLRFTDKNYPDGIVVDGTNWYAPAKDAVAYYMDPRNFLSEKNIFMFESLSYNKTQDASVPNILKSSFMKGSFTEEGKTKTYSDAFIEAGQASNVSSIHLASRSLQEMGNEMSSAASGTVPGYEGYYNFYNIGAYSGADNYLKGLEYAKNKGWNSRQKAITGGAFIIGNNYISKGQDSIYFQKFNVSSYRTLKEYTHQYMTNIMAPNSESTKIYESYKNNNKLSNNYTFTIPVYGNMPKSAFKVSRTDTIGGDEEEKPEEKPEEPVIPPEEKVKKAGYTLNNNYISNLPIGTDVSKVKESLINQKASVGIMNSNWQTKTSGLIATGDIINVDNKNFTAIIYGDIEGDGAITIKDLLLVQKYLLGSHNLNDANKIAADASHDATVTIKDLLLIQKHLLGTSSINQ